MVPERTFESSEAIDAAREAFAGIEGHPYPATRLRLLPALVLWMLLVAIFVAIYSLFN